MSLLVAALLFPFAVSPHSVAAGEKDAGSVHRQFDFWLGAWNVNNRSLMPGGATWSDTGQAHARISPLFDHQLVIERWSGKNHGSRVIGFSARAYDPALGKWVILLNWPGGQNVGFGTMRRRVPSRARRVPLRRRYPPHPLLLLGHPARLDPLGRRELCGRWANLADQLDHGVLTHGARRGDDA